MPMRIPTSAALLSVLMLGCGSSLPPPNDEWAAANGEITRAQQGGAPTFPDAKLHLQLAQEDLQKSKDLMDKDNRRAASIAAVAKVEAQLALSIARAQQTQGLAQQAQQDLQKAKGN
jgi:hypothetical protein